MRPTALRGLGGSLAALLVAAGGAAGAAENTPPRPPGGDDLADVIPPLIERRSGGPLSVTVGKKDRLAAGASIRASRGLYESVALGTYADELGHGRAAIRIDAAAGLGTLSITDLGGVTPVFDVTGRITVREIPLGETTSAITASMSRAIQPGFTYQRAGGTLGIGAAPRSFLRFGAGYTVEFADVTGPAAPFPVGACRKCVLSILEQAATLDRVDVMNPNRGYRLRLDLAEAGGPLGGDFGFVRVSPLAIALVPLSPRVTLAGRVRVGVLIGDAPVYERFFAGGSESVRSYDYQRLAPYARAPDGEVVPVGGRGLWLASVEARVALPPIRSLRVPAWSAVTFVDAGTVSTTVPDLLRALPSVAAGAGLRATTPLGAVRVDVGVSVFRPPLPVIARGVTPPHLAPWAVHLSAGEAF